MSGDVTDNLGIGNYPNRTLWSLGIDGIRSNANDSNSQCVLFDFGVSGVAGTAICTVGVTGNILSLLVLSRIDKTTSTFFLLRVLAILHTFVLISTFLSSSLPSILYFINGASSLRYIPYLQWFLCPASFMAMTATAWTLTLLTVYRYERICKNAMDTAWFRLRAAKYQVAIIILISTICGLPMYLERLPEKHIGVEEEIRVTLQETWLYFDMYYNIIYRMVILIVLRAIIPILLITILTYFIVRVLLRHVMVRRNSLRKADEPDEGQVVTKVLIAMAVSFVLSELPTAIYPFFFLIVDSNDCRSPYNYFTQIADNLALANSALNFFIYYPFVPTFRSVLRTTLTGCCWEPKEEPLSSKSRSRTVSSVVFA